MEPRLKHNDTTSSSRKQPNTSVVGDSTVARDFWKLLLQLNAWGHVPAFKVYSLLLFIVAFYLKQLKVQYFTLCKRMSLKV